MWAVRNYLGHSYNDKSIAKIDYRKSKVEDPTKVWMDRVRYDDCAVRP